MQFSKQLYLNVANIYLMMHKILPLDIQSIATCTDYLLKLKIHTYTMLFSGKKRLLFLCVCDVAFCLAKEVQCDCDLDRESLCETH